MSALRKLIQRESNRELAIEGEQRQFADSLFTDWRDRYVAQLCRYIRLHDAVVKVGRSEIMQGPPRAWCNAAVHLLTHGDLEIQDRFMRADQKLKDAMVQAVIDDDGIADLNGRFVELP